MSANQATLKLVGTSDLSAIARDLKNIATEGKNTGPALANLNKSLDASTKSATTLSQKVKSFGSNFSSSIASIGTLGGTVLNLSRQYQDLGDSQIAVDKAQLKVSKTTEATGVAQDKLNGMIAKGVTSGAEYEKALLDVKQAQEAQSLASQVLTERQEDHQRAQENFWIGLVPTVTSAGTSVITVLKDIGGTKGLGGLKTALTGIKGAFGGFGSLVSGLAGGLGGIGSSASGSVAGINGMAGATTGLGTAMKGLALSALPVALAIGGVALVAKQAGMVIHTIVSVMKGDMLEAVTTMEKTIQLVETIGPALGPFGGIQTSVFTALKPEIQKFKEELSKVPQVIKPVSAELQALDSIGQGMNGTVDNLIGGVMGLVRHAEAAPPPLNDTGQAIDGIGTAASTAAPQITGLDTSIDSLSGTFATITSNVGPATTGIAGLDAQMNPFRVTVQGLTADEQANADALSFMTGWLKQATAGTAAFEKTTARAKQQASQLTPVLNKATASLNKFAQAQQKASGGPSYQYGGAGKGPSGSHYTTFRNGKPIASGSGMAPPLRKAASGMHETINQPTWILAGEAGKERVDIGPGGGGGFSGTINVYVEGVLQKARYDINKFSGAVK